MAKKFARFEEVILVWTLVLMVALIFGQVVGRYIFQSAPSWTEELARYIHIFQVWVGASYAVKLRQHIRVEAFITRLKGTPRKIFEGLGVLIWFCISLFLAVFGTKLVLISLQHGQVTPALQLPIWIPFMAIPIGGAGMAIRLIQQLIEIWKGNYEKPESEEVIG
ncbi:TRAP transporter small permease [Bacillus sp. DTU_2020_1000418_1_SI_GHA_SEK_038]|uniref:TRAP transporter small permease n=1 Tax=Bacillus sp. DTU_2020_1000418_1_SI_GHA_SEK_038 TaxID=3077585 RepID=UPI0028EB651B|nr:TRAP transporter small permease [Bacillus sp. DTU_2020_1000418_1_SI_GHA_SEK_038]WNS75767.1 TRAP transporter small permease [Bacillus sp. DTU_2020_1000418_1_SI_GHA_SEK_038]